MRIAITDHLDTAVYRDALAIRRAVFIEEQGVSEAEELDDSDDKCLHLVLYQADEALATARLKALGDDIWKIQRVAVLAKARGRKLGAEIMQAAQTDLRKRGAKQLRLDAQTYAEGFYRTLGYRSEGAVFFDAGIEHIHMYKNLT